MSAWLHQRSPRGPGLRVRVVRRWAAALGVLCGLGLGTWAQQAPAPDHAAIRKAESHRFLARRGLSWEAPDAAARRTQLAETRAKAQRSAAATPNGSSGTTWQPLGPVQVTTAAYGAITGRISSIAVDPSDLSGNTVYLGTLGGGVWKSNNATGTASAVVFQPLTDTVSAFTSVRTGGSLSIGAVSVQPANRNVILAGTGDTNDALDSYYGVGILRSADGGNTWSLIGQSSDGFNSGLMNFSFSGEGFAAFAWSGTSTNTVVAAAGQSAESALVNADNSSNRGGLYYSTDAGQTWYMGTIEDPNNQVVQGPNYNSAAPGNSATSVIWNPVRKSFYAAIRYHGYYASTDGMTWTRLTNQPGAGLTTSNCPPDPGLPGSTACPIFRGVLAAQPFTGDTFALTTDANNLDQGLFQDVCSTSGTQATSCSSATVTFANQINDTALENGNGDTTIVQADYNLTLAAVHSQQDTILFAGTEDLFRCSLANSCAWRNTTNVNTCAAAMVAPSQHATDSTYGANGLLYFGNDGGLWRSTDTVGESGSVCASTDSTHFQNLNAGIGSLGEVEHFAVSQANPTDLLAGLGEFGSAATITGTGAWQQMLTGEGSYTAIDPTNPQSWFADASGALSIYHCTGGPNCTSSSWGSAPLVNYADDEDDADYFTDPAPWMLDPETSSNLLLGTCRVWRGPLNGSAWSASNLLSPMLDKDQQSFCNGNAEVRSIAAGLTATSGTEQIYVGMAGAYDGGGTVPGHVFTSLVGPQQGQTTWTDLYNSPVLNDSNQTSINPGGFAVAAIAVDPHDTSGQTVYVGLQGFSGNGVSQGFLYGSTNAGQGWYNVTSNLPAPVNSVVVDPNNAGTVYAALDNGVYYTTNIASCTVASNSCWTVYGSGLPGAPVTDLKIYNSVNGSVLEAATYGRGIWQLGLASTAATGTLSPSSYTFANQQINSTSAAESFTLANTGSNTMSISQVSLTGSFAETNNCGATLAAGNSCTINVTFTPTSTGAAQGTLTVLANVAGGELQSTLNGTGVTPGAITVNPASLSYAPTLIGTTTAAQSASFQNTGGSPVQLGTAGVSGNYAISANSCAATLAVGATCSISVTFTPQSSGPLAGTLSLPTNLAGSPSTVSLSGTGLAPASITFSPSPATFPATAEGATSSAVAIQATNNGGVSTPLGTPTVTNDYVIVGSSTTCGSSLGPGASCTISVTFSPQATGTRSGVLTLPASGVSGGSATDTLTGTGLAPAAATFSPSPATFPATVAGTTSSPQTVQITSTGGVALQIQSITASGDFAVVNGSSTCPASLAINTSCSVQVTFTPSSASTRMGNLTVQDNAQGGYSLDALSGTGLAPPTLSSNPNLLTFPVTAVGSTAAAQSSTFTNTGQATAQLGTITASGDFFVANTSCGSSLAAGANCSVSVTFSPSATGTRTGTLTVPLTNFPNGTGTVSLSGSGVPVPVVTLSPNPVSFAQTAQGSASAPVTVTATNTGQVGVQLGTPNASTNFQISTTSCGTTLAAGASCTLAVYFHPTQTGTLSGSLTLPGTMAGGSSVANLQGTSTPPGALSLMPYGMTFAGQLIHTQSATQTATVTNTGGTTTGVGAPVATGDFAVTSTTCGSTLAPGASCTVQVAFTPSAAGQRNGQLQVPDLAAGSSLVTTLTGTGLTPASLAFSPTSANFGVVGTGSTSSAAAFVLSNSGGVPADLQPATITGSGFAIASSNCGASLAPNATCSVSVTFGPSSTGSYSGTLSVASDAPGSPTTAQLTGTGVPPGSLTLAPSSLSFANTVVGAQSASQAVTATNNGGVPVLLGTPSVSSNYVLTNSCGATLAAGASCTLSVSFQPTAAGSLPGTLSYPGQFAGSPATLSLSGTGLAPAALALQPTSLNFGSVVLGQSSGVQLVTVSDPGDLPVTFGSITASGNFSIVSSSSSCGATLPAHSSCNLGLQFTAVGTGSASGVLTVFGNIAGNSVTAGLSATGVTPGALQISPSVLSFPTTATGAQSAPQVLTLGNTGGGTLTLAAPVLMGDYRLAGSTCSGTLSGGASCTYSVIFQPSTTGDRPGTFSISGGSGAGQQAQARLDGNGIAPAALSFAPGQLTFGQVEQGKSSAAQTTTLTNTGGLATSLAAAVLTGDYSISSNGCGTSLAPGASCAVGLVFNPSTTGDRPGTLEFKAPGGTPSASVSLDGTGTPIPYLILTPSSLAFPATQVGYVSSVENITIANIGTTTVTLSPPIIAGDFYITANTCGATLQPQFACTVSIVFAPQSPGAQSGLLTASDNIETHSATLTGTGLSAATDTLSATSLTFGTQAIGTVSTAQPVSLSNSGGVPLMGISTAVQGPFTAVNNCGTQLGGGLRCSIAVAYAPTAPGTQTGTLTISDAVRSQVVALAGSGAAPPTAFASPLSINFGGYAVNGVSPPQVVTITNNGQTAMSGVSLALSDVDFTFASNTCGATLAAGASCTVGISFAPQSTSASQGTLTVTSPSIAAPLAVSLSGAGEDFTLAVVGYNGATIVTGQTAKYQISVTPVGNTSGSLTFGCSGLPANATCTLTPVSMTVANGSTGSLAVAVATGVTTSSQSLPPNLRQAPWLLGALALLLPCGLVGVRGRRAFAVFALACLLVLFPTACGVHASSGVSTPGTPGGGATPAGAYTITVTGSFPGAQRTATVTLVVE